MVYNIKWAEGSRCVGLSTDLFFDEYENGSHVAKHVDTLCSTCPLQRECLSVGVARKEWGVWGGIYLEDGEINDDFNAHKTPEDWSKLWMRLTTQTK